ncbi:uncharacterized protein LOC141909560 isoform X1 [Tubulanus polymorphus]|uniref:uncharacterized protein LOC141909560 isoform X1 n=1 Tax=Tubulanus polymorphus TaxID=672921 RepID=UPI003DA5BFD3
MMRSVGAVTDSTPIVTTVQDFQVFDLPESIFSEHDIRVDYVITPTQVIQCGKHTQPRAINWSLLTEDRLNRIPVLKKLRLFELKAGKDVRLKDEEEAPSVEKLQEEADGINDDDENEPPNYYRRRRRYRNDYSNYRRRDRRPNSEGGDGSQVEEGGSPSRGGSSGGAGGATDKDGRVKRRFGRRRFSRRRRRTNSNKENDETGGSEGERVEGEEGEKKTDRRRRPFRRPNRRGNSQTEGGNSDSAGDGESPSGAGGAGGRPQRRFPRTRTYSVYVGGLPPSLRVSHFKKEVRNKDVNPIQVVWHGNNGHAFLVFMGEDEANSALDRLGDFEITNDKGKKKLRIEVANRSRQGGGGGGTGGKSRGGAGGESGDGGDEATGSGHDDN